MPSSQSDIRTRRALSLAAAIIAGSLKRRPGWSSSPMSTSAPPYTRQWGPKPWPAHYPCEGMPQAAGSALDSSLGESSGVEPTLTSLALLTTGAGFILTLGASVQPLPMMAPQRQNSLSPSHPYPPPWPTTSSGTELELSDHLVTSLFVDAPPPLFFWSYLTPCRILVLQPGMELAPPAVEARSLNHGTAREVDALLIVEAEKTHKARQPWAPTTPRPVHTVPCAARKELG